MGAANKIFGILTIALIISGGFGFLASRRVRADATYVPQQDQMKQAKTCPSADDTACNRWYYLTEKNKPEAWKYDRAGYSKKQRWYHVGQPTTPPKPKIIVLEGVHFDFDKADLRPDAIPILMKNLPELQHENIHVIVVGHADNRGTDEYNRGLSERRARAVMNYYIGHGIPADRLSAEGRGEFEPIAVNEAHQQGVSVKVENDGLHAGRAMNRRIELHITSISSSVPTTLSPASGSATTLTPEE